ncbi:DUF956 family protein [Furfurilactobacillus entadae]|uniref:DUF956 family protein n=1 Tax=Furfurilactobacillus entadae TaxID=2922307 RepID=UPI0035E6293C
MAESLNTKVDLVTEGTSYMGMSEYGKLMVGDKAFEFYNHRDTNKFVQIPWEEVDNVVASVMFRGKWIPRFTIQTKHNGAYRFSARKPKVILRAIRNYVGPDHVVKALTFGQMILRDFRGLAAKRSTKRN